MESIKRFFNEQKCRRMVDKLNERKFNAIYLETLEDAKKYIYSNMTKGATVSIGGSVTLDKINMVEELRVSSDYKFFDRYQKLPFPEIVEIYRQGLTSDYLLSSVNAITEDGYLVNVDCSGNRIAGMIFGAKNVIIVAGVNKIVKNLDAALQRLEEIAPLNCKRLGHKTPCAETGVCVDCMGKTRMCNHIHIAKSGVKFENRITVLLIPEEVGF